MADFGTLGSGWDCKFLWVRRMFQISNFDRETFLIYTLELKLHLLECFPYVCIGSHAFAMFAILVCVIYNNVHYKWLPDVSSSDMWWFPMFFLLSVSARLKKIITRAL